jgi:predicted dehydrogenase
MKRRQFLRNVAFTGAAGMILPQMRLFGAETPSNKLNVALIGTWGRADAHFAGLEKENVVAICDVNEQHLDHGAQRFPNAKKYVDWRKCLDQKGINAVVCCTPDHTHAHIGMAALKRDYHLFMEKPLGITVEEARMLREAYLKKKNKLAVQTGTQRHAFENFNRIREMIRDGVIGDLQDVCAWGNRQLRRPGYLPAAGEPPAHLHWDLWIGPSVFHPFNPDYISGGPGMNCLQWNMYWDFGTGQVGDMGSHTMDLVWNAIDATFPTSASAKGEAFNPEVTPVTLETHFEIPANDWRDAITCAWYQGGAMPEAPVKFVNLNAIDHGAMFEGSKGVLVADFQKRIVYPQGNQADMTYYKPRSRDKLLPPLKNFQGEWIDACKGDLKTSCDFDYNGRMMEMMYLGLVAYRAGKKVEFDGKTGKIKNDSDANKYLTRQYRQGWEIEKV